MTELGQANFSTIDRLRNLPANTLGAITSDYSVIMWWARSMREMAEALAQEIKDAAAGQGNAIKKREDTHKMAQANRAFAHFRW